MDAAVDGEAISVGRTLIERRTRRYARVIVDRNGLGHDVHVNVQSCTAKGVYTDLSKGARGILFPDNRNQGLPIEDRKDTKRPDAALSQECGKGRFIERMEDPVTDGFPKPGKIVKQRLRLGAEFVLIGLSKVSPIYGRQVGVLVKSGENQGALGMQHTMPLPQRDKRRRHIRKGKIADHPAYRTGFERKGAHPIGLKPPDRQRRHGR